MSELAFIYSLKDPRDGEVRYVGKANNCQRRFVQHLRDKSPSHKTNWINSLFSVGLKPVMDILEEVKGDSWVEGEQKWIRTLKEQGCKLVNATDGGEGCFNPTKETREKISSYHRGRIVSLESRKRMSIAQKNSPLCRAKLLIAGKISHERSRGRKMGPLTEEHRHKISLAKMGVKPSEEHRKAATLGRIGLRVSEETKRKIGEANHEAWEKKLFDSIIDFA